MENENLKSSGIRRETVRLWAMIFLTLGTVSRSILQRGVLHLDTVSGAELLHMLQTSGDTMFAATLSLILMAAETCGVVLYAFLLTEGMEHTENYLRYLGRTALLAVITEVPFNFAVSGTLLARESLNPVFGVVLCLIMLYFFKRYENSASGSTAVRILVFAAAMLWAVLLKIQHGDVMIVMVTVLYAFRKKKQIRLFAGAVGAVLCCVLSPYFLAAPMAFLVLHFYHGERGTENRIFSYAFYPVLLILCGLTVKFLF